jgi:hypothetical protein
MFAVLLPEAGADNTRLVVRQLREALASALKSYPEMPDQMIEIAKRHMRLTKERGKNGVSYLSWNETNDKPSVLKAITIYFFPTLVFAHRARAAARIRARPTAEMWRLGLVLPRVFCAVPLRFAHLAR